MSQPGWPQAFILKPGPTTDFYRSPKDKDYNGDQDYDGVWFVLVKNVSLRFNKSVLIKRKIFRFVVP
jgi:hypothetical protein